MYFDNLQALQKDGNNHHRLASVSRINSLQRSPGRAWKDIICHSNPFFYSEKYWWVLVFSANKTKAMYSIAYLELLSHKYKIKLANNHFCLHEALAVYFSLSLHTAEKELGYPFTCMAEKIAKVVTYPAVVSKKNCPQLLPLLLCKEHPSETIQHSWLSLQPLRYWQRMGYLGQEGKGEVSPNSPTQAAVGCLLSLTGMGLFCILWEFRRQLRSFQHHFLQCQWPKSSIADKDNSQICHAKGQLGHLSG